MPSLLARVRPYALAGVLVALVAWVYERGPYADPGSVVLGAPFTLTRVGRVHSPTAIAVSPAGELFIAEQEGTVVALDPATGTVRSVLAVPDVTAGGETGLLGLALSPGWPADPQAFLNFTSKSETLPGAAPATPDQLHTVIARFHLPASGPADPGSLGAVLRFDQPYANHNSGGLAFGADGMLYASVGDGGAGGDPQGHGQNTMDWLGSILRIDVRTDPSAGAGAGAAAPPPYRVPADNPFVGKPGFLPEIWAYGVRNPWGMHVDRGGEHRLYFADVGQDRYEEVDIGVAGGNYGWNRMEGTHGYPRGEPGPGDTIPPVAEYSHTVGGSVTGGVVCRDPRLPHLAGVYIFADFATGLFFTLRDGELRKVATTGMHPTTFADATDGRAYVADYDGTIYRIDPPG